MDCRWAKPDTAWLPKIKLSLTQALLAVVCSLDDCEPLTGPAVKGLQRLGVLLDGLVRSQVPVDISITSREPVGAALAAPRNTFAPVAQLVEAPRSERGGFWFEPR
jgi:hypothetical protein